MIYEIMVAIIVEAETPEDAKILAEEVLPSIGYFNDNAEVVDTIITGEPMEQ